VFVFDGIVLSKKDETFEKGSICQGNNSVTNRRNTTSRYDFIWVESNVSENIYWHRDQ